MLFPTCSTSVIWFQLPASSVMPEESRSGQRSAVDLSAVVVGLTVALERFGTVGLSVVAEDRQFDVAFAAADAVERRYRIGNAFQHAFGDRRESPAVPAGDDEAFRGEAQQVDLLAVLEDADLRGEVFLLVPGGRHALRRGIYEFALRRGPVIGTAPESPGRRAFRSL